MYCVCAICPNIIYFTSTSAVLVTCQKWLVENMSSAVTSVDCDTYSTAPCWGTHVLSQHCRGTFCNIGSLLSSVMAVPACRRQNVTSIISWTAAEVSVGKCGITCGLSRVQFWRESDKVISRVDRVFVFYSLSFDLTFEESSCNMHVLLARNQTLIELTKKQSLIKTRVGNVFLKHLSYWHYPDSNQ